MTDLTTGLSGPQQYKSPGWTPSSNPRGVRGVRAIFFGRYSAADTWVGFAVSAAGIPSQSRAAAAELATSASTSRSAINQKWVPSSLRRHPATGSMRAFEYGPPNSRPCSTSSQTDPTADRGTSAREAHRRQRRARPRGEAPPLNSLLTGKLTGNFADSGPLSAIFASNRSSD